MGYPANPAGVTHIRSNQVSPTYLKLIRFKNNNLLENSLLFYLFFFLNISENAIGSTPNHCEVNGARSVFFFNFVSFRNSLG
jgi:hypothetical protein